MAIFSRRILQKLINENNKILLKRHTKKHIRELNRVAKNPTLAHEWEVVLINTFSKVGKVVYEKDFGGNNFADIYFEAYNDSNQNFVADITTVSDKGLEEKNPVEALRMQLEKILRDFGLSSNFFDLRIGANKDSKVELKLPGRSRFSQVIFNEGFKNFILDISKNPRKYRTYVIKKENVDLTIEYKSKKSGGYSYPSYKKIFSLTNNTIYQALENKKNQLKGVNFTGPVGILLCDGGCRSLNTGPFPMTFDGSYTADNVINYFLQENRSIYFVLTIIVEQRNGIFPKKTKYEIMLNLYRGHLFNDMNIDINAILNKLITRFPKPQRDAMNALHRLKGKKPNKGLSYFGGWQMIDNEILEVKISARGLLELLAGVVDQKKFFEDHDFVSFVNPFKAALDEGKLVNEIFIEKSEFDDDDWITFKLRGPDPAISPYLVPKSN